MRRPTHLTTRPGRMLLLGLPPLVGAGLLGCALLLGWAEPAGSVQAPAPAQEVAGPGAAAAAARVPAPAGLLVDVSGAVVHPGLYRLSKGERAYAAIEAAGGLSPEADTSRLPNLAGLLKDGEQIKVPFRSGPARTTTGSAAGAVDLNLSTTEELLTVPGFDDDLAQAVITYRTQYGGFASIRELVTVLGMSEAAYATARRYLRV